MSKSIYLPLILTESGQIPQLPDPVTLIIGDSGFDQNIHLMVGQQAYNAIDDKWFYRSSNKIIEGGITTPNELYIPIPQYLTVVSGTSSGAYEENDVVNIAANIPDGYDFLYWDGDIENLANKFNSTTTITIPNYDTNIVAIFGKSLILEFSMVANETLTLPFYDIHGYNCIINWGDGEISHIISYDDPNKSHTYTTTGKFNVKIAGTCKGLYFNNSGNASNLTKIIQWGDVGIEFFYNSFYGCSNLTNLPIGSIGYSGITEFYQTFRECTSLTSIPSGFFDENINATLFYQTFYNCSSLTELPDNLFYNNILVHNFERTFSYCNNLTDLPSRLFNEFVSSFIETFSGCKLITLPSDLFVNCINTKIFNGVFKDCTSLTTIPTGLFDNNISATTFNRCFSNIAITEIPAELFDNNILVTNFSETFYNCKSLTTIPTGLFDNNISATTFYNCFYNIGITEIPAGLFDNNILVTNFSGTFSFCKSLTTIPTGLFRYNSAVITFYGTFRECVSLRVLPEDLFYYNDNANEHRECFYYCRNLQLPTRLFNLATLTSNFKYFMRVSTTSYSPTGTIQELWTTSSYGTAAFMYCTSISNYSSIPTIWK